jgi:hypothetical protein
MKRRGRKIKAILAGQLFLCCSLGGGVALFFSALNSFIRTSPPLLPEHPDFYKSTSTSAQPTEHQNRPPQLTMGSVVLPHLVTGWHVDQAIMSEEDRLVVIRFGRDWDPDCMRQDEVLYRNIFPFPRPLPPACHPLLTNPPTCYRRNRRPSQKLRGRVRVRPRPSAGLQADVRAVRPGDADVFLPQ